MSWNKKRLEEPAHRNKKPTEFIMKLTLFFCEELLALLRIQATLGVAEILSIYKVLRRADDNLRLILAKDVAMVELHKTGGTKSMKSMSTKRISSRNSYLRDSGRRR